MKQQPSVARRRHRQSAYLVLYGVVAAGLLWPLYTVAARATPLIFGLPPSLVWPAGCIGVLFVASCWLYNGDVKCEDADAR